MKMKESNAWKSEETNGISQPLLPQVSGPKSNAAAASARPRPASPLRHLKLFDDGDSSDSPDPGASHSSWRRPAFSPSDPPSPAMTLSEFYRFFVVPSCLSYAKPRHFREMEISLNYWARFTLDPPLEQISPAAIHQFTEGLKTIRGRFGKPVSDNTIRKHVVHVQSILDRAGPPSRKKQGASLLPQAPFIQRPSLVINRNIKRFTVAEIGILLDAAGKAARSPARPAWRLAARLVGMLHALRLQLRASHRRPNCPGMGLARPRRAWLVGPHSTECLGREKVTAGRDYYLNAWALAAVDRMRPALGYKAPSATRESREMVAAPAADGDAARAGLSSASNRTLTKPYPSRPAAAGSKIFPWAAAVNTLWRTLQRMHAAAGMPGSRRFGFHGLRKACNTELSRINPAAAKMAMGHSGGDVTIDHYTVRRS